MSYNLLRYFAFFLPIVLIVYQAVPKKYRFIVLLLADYAFFIFVSNFLVVYLIAATFGCYGLGIWLEKVSGSGLTGKALTKKKRKVLAIGILANLSVIFVLKYFNFFGENIFSFLNLFGLDLTYNRINFLVPIGISYYTLMIISYLTDVYRGKIQTEHNISKIALYLSFFPQIMEGPIARYHETADALYEGNPLTYVNVTRGYQRIIWGLLKKYLIADRIAPVVSSVFNNYQDLDGSVTLFGILCYTCQLYMEFSGCMDIIIGSGEVFGIKLPENFKQPFLAKDASDFWHRWHITLGTWFKDYIFYPVSLAKPVKNLAKKVKNKCGRGVSKFVAPAIALFCVWSCNGLWHGAKWTYIFYGMYYFVIILVENIIEAPVIKLTTKLHINRESIGYRIFQVVKIFIIINIGEMFFRADTVGDGFNMLGKVFTDFHLLSNYQQLIYLGMDIYDLAIIPVGLILVTVVGAINARGKSVRDIIAGWKLPIRWIFWYLVIIVVAVFGAYGAGYDSVAMIYAGY